MRGDTYARSDNNSRSSFLSLGMAEKMRSRAFCYRKYSEQRVQRSCNLGTAGCARISR